MSIAKKIFFLALIIPLAVVFLPPKNVFADTLGDLRQEIDKKSEKIKNLEIEAQKYRDAIVSKQEQGKNLKTELARIGNVISELKREINLTSAKIQRALVQIQSLDIEIKDKEDAIQKLHMGLASSLQTLWLDDQASVLEVLAQNKLLSDFFNKIEWASLFEKKILSSLGELKILRQELQDKQAQTQDKKKELEDLKTNLRGQKDVQENTQKDRTQLLSATQNEEKKYQTLLEEQEKKRAALESEISAIESQIKVTIDPNSLPPKGQGILGWPLPDLSFSSCFASFSAAKNCITQFFGYTSFAAIGAYQGKGHNGVDFRADIGTPVFAAENGIIQATGDTDQGCPRASYGKWILIKHPDNLSTLYGHLSAIEVYAGQNVSRGQVIGYSGKTGYATGPHLHLSLFASPAVEIQTFKSKTCGRFITIPVSAVNGYLNPLDYL